MANNQNPPTEPTIADLMAALQGFQKEVSARLDGIEQRQAEFDEALAEHQPLTPDELAELAEMTDEQLAEQGLTRAEVQAAMDAVSGPAAPGDSPADAAGKGAAAAADSQTATALSALRRQVVELQQKFEGTHEEQLMENAFAVLEQKIGALGTELAAKNEQIQHLQAVIKKHGANVRAASPVPESIRMFSAEEEGLTEFEGLVQQTIVELSEKNPKWGKGALKAEAFRRAMKADPAGYAEFRKKGGSIQLAE